MMIKRRKTTTTTTPILLLLVTFLNPKSVAFTSNYNAAERRGNFQSLVKSSSSHRSNSPAFVVVSSSSSPPQSLFQSSVASLAARRRMKYPYFAKNKDDDEEDEEVYEEEDDDDEEDYEYEYEYEYEEVEDEEEAEEEYEEEEDEEEEDEEDEYIELQDDPDDPNYQAQKKAIEQTIQIRKAMQEINDFDGADYVMNKMTQEEMDAMDADPIMMQVEEQAKDVVLTQDDLNEAGIDLDNELEEVLEKEESILDAYTGSDAFPDEEGNEELYPNGLSKQDLMELDESRETINRLKKEMEEGTIIENKLLLMDEEAMWDSLSNGTQHEIMTCLDHMDHGGSDEPLKWLMFDLGYNVTNLILSSVKYNPEAPVLLSHWYPQLTAYERYGYVREIDYDFTLEDVENSDLDELHNYWANLGYDAPPKKHPSETGIVTWDRDGLDDDERELAALENWYDEVYEEDFENHYFDDDDFTPEQNVYDRNFNGEIPKEGHKFIAEREDLEKQFTKMYPEAEEGDIEEHTDKYGRIVNYTVSADPELEEQFRGHLVVAIGPILSDVEVASSITARMASEFGKKVFVETRVLNHVREDDNLFEIWLESYEIDLLHSKRKATYNSQEWEGPKEVDEKQMDYLVERVGHMISDDFRYSYRMFDWDFVGQ